MQDMKFLPGISRPVLGKNELDLINEVSRKKFKYPVRNEICALSIDMAENEFIGLISINGLIEGDGYELIISKELVEFYLEEIEGIEAWPNELLHLRALHVLDPLLKGLSSIGLNIEILAVQLLAPTQIEQTNGGIPLCINHGFRSYRFSLFAQGEVFTTLTKKARWVSVVGQSGNDFSGVPVCAKLIVGNTVIPGRALNQLNINSVILVDYSNILREEVTVLVAGKRILTKMLDSRMLSVMSIENIANYGDKPMDDNVVNLENVEVDLTFTCGSKVMKMSELSDLSPGFVFELEASLASLVSIEVNGKKIGSGRLVEVGEQLGVQVISLAESQHADGIKIADEMVEAV